MTETQQRSVYGHTTTKVSKKKYALGLFGRWFLTLAISLALCVVLVKFSADVIIMSKSEKKYFNGLIIGLSISLSLSFTGFLNKMVKDLRWWLISRRYLAGSTVKLILQADGIISAVKVAVKSKSCSLYTVAVFWLLIAIGSQVGLACLGLCYSVGEAKKVALVDNSGSVAIPDMRKLETSSAIATNYSISGSEEYTANIFGTMSLVFNSAGIEKTPSPGDVRLLSDPFIFCDDRICRYYFREEGASESSQAFNDTDFQPLVVATNRYLDISTTCDSFQIQSGGNGSVTELIVDRNGNNARTIEIPFAGGINQTTFITNTSQSCGTGCGFVAAFESSQTSPWFYECQVTIGPVVNATMKEHEVSDSVRLLAARGIALQGYAISSLVQNVESQYQIYPAESVFGTPSGGTSNVMAATISRFAAGVIATTAQYNTKITVTGTPPVRAAQLQLTHFGWLVIILLVAVIVQLVLSISALVMTRRVIIPSDGLLGIAELLRTMTTKPPSLVSNAVEKIDPKEVENSVCVEKDCAKCGWIYKHRCLGEANLYDLYMERRSCTSRSNPDKLEDSKSPLL